MINCHRPSGPRTRLCSANDSLMSWRHALPPTGPHRVSTKLYSAAQGALSKGPQTRQALSRTIYRRPAWRQGAGCDDLWSALQGVVCSDSVSPAGSSKSFLAGWLGRWVGTWMDSELFLEEKKTDIC